ncbi:MAG: histone deacetylase family protein [Sphingomonadaceae bacterium]|nr:histone deacetylase family protein [Sphingomonadaceae bacterium]
MTTALVTHDACLGHDPGPGHPERIGRLSVVLAALDEERFPKLMRENAPRATAEQIGRVHDRGYVEQLLELEVTEGEHLALDADTVLSSGSVEAALRAAGGAIRAVDLVMAGRANAAFAAVRPPGHHAEPARGMGFCLFNNVAIAAQHARDRWGVTRIAVADFDVHHGNGTQAAFWDDDDLFFASSHQSPFYPGTGGAEDSGASGNIVNAPLPSGTGTKEFRDAWQRDLLPAIDEFAPEMLLISAGFDGHARDPLAQFLLETDDFGWLTRELVALATHHCRGRVISLLEGGYDLVALAECAADHVKALEWARDG